MADYQNLTARYTYGKILTWGDLADLAENDVWLKENGWQDDTKAVFFQAAAPSGWVQDTSQNNKLLRVVSGAGGGTGGSASPIAAITLQHTHTVTTQGAHTHTMSEHGHSSALGSAIYQALDSAVLGSGDELVDFHRSGSGGSTVDKLGQLTESVMTDADATSSNGSHTHPLANSLTDITLAYCDVIVATKSTSSGFVDITALFFHDETIRYEPFDDLAANDVFNQARLTPSGTVMPYFMAAAPTGWTNVGGLNAKALRVVSGAGGGNGGSADIASAISLSHTHVMTAAGSHTHTTGAHRHNFAGISGQVAAADIYNFAYAAWDSGTGFWHAVEAAGVSRTVMRARTKKDGVVTTQALSQAWYGGDHTHTVDSALSNITIAYCDVIHCSKDASGHPYAFEDMSGVMGFKKLVSRQRLARFAKVDEHLKFHTMASGARAFFFQAAAPLHWTKLTDQADKALRVVSGAGGTTGGSQGLSAGIPLAHTHGLSTDYHNHLQPGSGHQHERDTEVNGNAGNNLVDRILVSLNTTLRTSTSTVSVGFAAGASSYRPITQYTEYTNSGIGSFGHNHGGATVTALSNVTLAYADVILCEKD